MVIMTLIWDNFTLNLNRTNLDVWYCEWAVREAREGGGGETGNTVHCRLGAGRVSASFTYWIPGQSLLYSAVSLILSHTVRAQNTSSCSKKIFDLWNCVKYWKSIIAIQIVEIVTETLVTGLRRTPLTRQSPSRSPQAPPRPHCPPWASQWRPPPPTPHPFPHPWCPLSPPSTAADPVPTCPLQATQVKNNAKYFGLWQSLLWENEVNNRQLKDSFKTT